jgi:NADH-quinone oxidoreductase subunit G
MTMARIWVDGRACDANPEQNLLHACLSLGFDIPYFCWHPALGSVGACRQCAVKLYKDEADARGKIVMSCMTPVTDGARLSIADEEVAAFRRGIIEGLMLHHPHDCPVCDEGGECHLQDMTVMTGHVYRRYSFAKRTFKNQYLGPFVNHEMNRCIQCYRCVRFYGDYAGGKDLAAFGIRDRVFFGRARDGRLKSPFSGNLVEVCPTGVFTDATLKRHYTRKWDLQFAPSVCMHCGVGCNTSPGARYGSVRRVVNRYNDQVNGYFLCDRGRFGYEYLGSDRRVTQPLVRKGAVLQPAERNQALSHVRSMLQGARGIVGIGSPRAPLEANYALQKLVGKERFCAGLSSAALSLQSAAIELLRRGPARIASVRDVQSCDAVLVLGEDLHATAPRIALAVLQSVRQQPMKHARRLRVPAWMDHSVRQATHGMRGPLFVVSSTGTELDDFATEALHVQPHELVRLAIGVAQVSGGGAASGGADEAVRRAAEKIGASLRGADRPLVVAGASLGSAELLQAAAAIAGRLHSAARPAYLAFTAPECNSFGLGLMGGHSLEEAASLIESGEADTLVVVENDLYRRAPAPVVEVLLKARQVIVLDHLLHRTAQGAHAVLPAASFAEGEGTLVNGEGRAQRFFRVLERAGEVQASWRWLGELGEPSESERAGDFDGLVAAMAAEVPALAGVERAAPAAATGFPGGKVPRKTHRYSGRTAMYADKAMHEPKPEDDPDSPLSFSMEGEARPPGTLVPFFWAPGWNSPQATIKHQLEPGGELRGGSA